MASFSWDDYEEDKVASNAPPEKFDWGSFEAVKHEPSQIEAGLRGAAQGASFGFSDELAGIGGAIGGALGKAGVDEIHSTNPRVESQIRQLAAKDPSALETYQKTRDEERAKNLEASTAHPGTYLGGNLVGGIANPVTRGVTGLKGVLGLGATQGLGGSESDLTKGDVGGTAADTGIGTAAGALGYGVGKAIPKVFGTGKYLGKKALTTLGPSEEAINARLAGRAQPDAKNYADLGEDLSGSLKKLKNQIFEASNEANAHLSSEKNIPKPYLSSPLDEAISGLGLEGKEGKVLLGPTDKAAVRTLESLKDDISKLPDNLSQKDLKKVIQKMDDNINWDDQSQNKLNQILEGLRHKFDDSLKFQNSAYGKAMEPVSDRVGLLNDLKRQFNLKNIPNEGLKPTDTTASKIQTSLRDNKAVTQENLDRLKGYTGDDYLEKARDFQLANQFENTAAQGSRRTVLGGAVGGLLSGGGPAGIGVGAAAGATLDRYGGQALGKMIDTYVAAGNTKVFGKFGPALQKAAEKGPEALGVTASILSSNPEFKEILKNLSK